MPHDRTPAEADRDASAPAARADDHHWQHRAEPAVDAASYGAWCDDRLVQMMAAPIQRAGVTGHSGDANRAETPARGAAEGGDTSGSTQELAQAGVSGGGERLPHLDAIQASFGDRHDVSGVTAHVGGAAAAASHEMGARGYATGDHVAFAQAPDLHLAAHEAAHTVQQRGGVQLAGGVGQAGDRYEQHADAVADRVVRGESAAELLDAYAGGGSGGGAVQHKEEKAEDVHLPAHVDNTVKPTWSKPDVMKIQTELKRLGLYALGIDGDLGKKTDSGLVEAFGDDTWRTMAAPDVLARLKAAAPPTGDKGEHNFRYGEMFADGLLDLTLGIGFDETDAHVDVIDQMTVALGARNFHENAALGMQLYKEAKRTVPPNPYGTFWVKPNALTYKPPAGAARPIHAVVRFITNRDGSKGGQAAEAFKEGMVQSDASMYSGHGRYGSGPDFDRNFETELLDDKGNLEQAFDNYEELEEVLKTEGKPQGRSAWQQFEWRLARKRVVVKGSNAGNIRMTKNNNHAGEFGAKLMYWQLNQNGVAPVTGAGGELDKQTKAHPERKYRVNVFDGCRTQDYESEMRKTPGMDSHSVDAFESTISLYWRDFAATMTAFLDSILHMQSAEDTAKAMDVVQGTTGQAGKGTIKGTGLDDNPVFK